MTTVLLLSGLDLGFLNWGCQRFARGTRVW